MKKLIYSTSLIGLLTLLSSTANALTTPVVPEIDAGMAAITIGLTAGVSGIDPGTSSEKITTSA